MADKMQSPVLDRLEDKARYQPLSLLAVVAVLVAGVLTVVIVLLTAAGLYSRKPVLEPVLILMAVGSAILALAARWHIANSEGTRAGHGLAKIALWLSVICGLCYGAYFGGNYFAIRKQANDMAMKNWFEPLKEGKFDEAYFYTIDPVQRQNTTVRDVGGRFGDSVQKFRQQELVLLLDRARQEAQIEPRGIRGWSKETVGYVVNLNYLVATREGEFDVLLTVIGSDSKDLQRREWYVTRSRDQVQARRLTTYGRLLMELQMDAERFMREWVTNKSLAGHEKERYLDTLPVTPEQRRQRLVADFLRMYISHAFSCAAEPSCGMSKALVGMEFFGPDPLDRTLYFPDAASLAKQLVTVEKTKDTASEEFKTQSLPKLLEERVINLPRAAGENEIPTTLEFNADEVRISMPVGFQMPIPAPYQYRGRVFITTRDPALLAKIKELQSAPWPAPLVVESSPTPLITGFQPNWFVSEIRVDPTPLLDPRVKNMMEKYQEAPPPKQ